MNCKGWMLAAALLAATTAQATCYSVHSADGKLILESSRTPVNLALPLGDTVPMKFGPGASMTVSGTSVFCRERHVAQAQEVAVVAVPVKKRAAPKVEAPVREATDEELLALKPEEVVPMPPVQAVEVKVVGSAEETPAGVAVQAQRQMAAGGAAGKVAAKQE